MSQDWQDPYAEPAGSDDPPEAAPRVDAAREDADRSLWAPEPEIEPSIAPEPFAPVSAVESERRNGLAFSAGIAFFGAMVIMMFIGWLADLLLGSSPWGLVGGIVLGAAIGFFQLFQLTSRIFRTSDGPSVRPLLSRSDDETDD